MATITFLTSVSIATEVFGVSNLASTDMLKLELQNTDGAMSLSFLDQSGITRDVLEIPAITLDGAEQANFDILAHANRTTLRNQSLSVTFEELSDRSIAMTWIPHDLKSHHFEVRIRDNSNYYGGGERFNALNQKGNILPMMSIDRPEKKGSNSYKPVPFIMSTRGYGLWVDSFAPGFFDLNATDREHLRIDYHTNQLRVALIVSPQRAQILEEFVRMTGKPPVPPTWAFAPWKSRDVHRNRDEVLQDAEWSRRYDLPSSVIVIDSPWETSYNNFVLNEEQFAEPHAMFARLGELGFYPCLWLTPFVNTKNVVDMQGIQPGPSSCFEEAVAAGHLVKRADGQPMLSHWWKGEGGLVDFTDPAAVKWWHEQLQQTLQWGVRAFKCDDGEGNFIHDAVFKDGTSAEAMKNRYAALYLQTMHGFIDEHLGGDGVLLGRCGFTGTQRYPFCWAGDNEANFSFDNGLPSVIIAGQTAAISGIPFWGHDIAGYIGQPTKELFIRWTQFGAFSPLMMTHMTSNLGPWDFDEETLGIYRDFAKLHTRLFPYIYNAAHEAAASGMPIIRPMAMAFENDPQAADHIYQYLFGPDLLVAPMYQGGEHRTVYLPECGWVDYWSGHEHQGGKVVEVRAPLEQVPLFVRSGAIIPMIPADVDTLISRQPGFDKDVVCLDERRILQIWPGESAEIATWDGLSAKTVVTGDNVTLTLDTHSKQPIVLEIMYRKCEPTETGDAETAWQYNSERRLTSVALPAFQGKRVLKWRQQSD
ncbi:MAG TPA: glycoside hydrolase family 31 protein [Phycisphaerae bacterium]|nr:glycoside hydrolase family 31 protein [Phycisphaerae bacterium]